ncbi:M20 metallopeptidase family protein [Edaphobacillus lindanitolerans]|uniref:Amidohydrolase n=1 Tax=Edaphobacillus lindanitolerans TaxID=550447 RepID=A0A1U7PJB2_9BACI|nr:amidohydrolase [Edaphobacillus lindanitolerans]SIT80986.1 amidohydrolase [Edaphobacillus lindanitolerans]
MDLTERLTRHRRTLHRIPEAGFEEFKTARYIREVLDGLGLAYEKPMETATVAWIGGDGAGRTLAFRADIDGLPIEEETGLPFRSEHPGWMHACGHDGHTAILLAFAERCMELKKEGRLPCNILLVFQPSEESGGGAARLVRSGVFDAHRPDAVFGLHVMPDEEEGLLLTRSGELTASATEYRIRVNGRSAHVADKQNGASALGALLHVASGIERIQQYHLDGLNRNIVHIGSMRAGEAINTVASSAYLEGTIRTYSAGDLERVTGSMRKLAESADLLFGAETELDVAEGYPPVINSPSLLPLSERAADAAGLKFLLKEKPYLFGEDFSFYSEVAPVHFAFLGVRNEGLGHTAALHTPHLNFREEALAGGVRFFEQALMQGGSL